MNEQEEILPRKPRIIINPCLSDIFLKNIFLHIYKSIAKCGKGFKELRIYIYIGETYPLSCCFVKKLRDILQCSMNLDY